MYFSQAIERSIKESGLPVLTEFSLYLLVQPILADHVFAGEKVQRVPAYWYVHQLRAMIRRLVKQQVLAPDDDFKSGVWHVIGALRAAAADEAICLVDPFAYVSHLSAMQRYGLTDRTPDALHMTTPARALWSELRIERMVALLGEASPTEVPFLVRISLDPPVRQRPIVLHETRRPAEPASLAGTRSRIAPIGRVFVDMLDQPQLCGGIQHVLDCFEHHANDWREAIVAAVDDFDSPIIKVRAGYILDEVLGLSDPAVARWVGCAQRGGSRKLDPHAPYGSRFSEKWMMALNV